MAIFISSTIISQSNIEMKLIPTFLINRIDKKTNVESREQSFTALYVLAKVLIKNADSSIYQLKYNSYGKPFLQDSKWCISLSHSFDRVVVALSDQGEVGVDIEHKRQRPDLSALGDLPSLLIDGKDNLFFENWTLMESCAKADGRGIVSTHLSRMKLIGTNRVSFDNKQWFYKKLNIWPDYAVHLCSESEISSNIQYD